MEVMEEELGTDFFFKFEILKSQHLVDFFV
jgi:hypothetical protein